MDIIEQFRAALAADPPEAESVVYDSIWDIFVVVRETDDEQIQYWGA